MNLRSSLCIVILVALPSCFANGKGNAVQGIAYERSEDFAPLEVGARSRRSERTLLFAERLIKYGMFQNSLHYWIDRPLYFDRSTRPERMAYDTASSFKINSEQLRRYMLDGFDVFVSRRPGGRDEIGQMNKWFIEGGYDDLKVLPILSYGESIDRHGPNVKALKEAIALAQCDPRFPRIGGKVLVPTYNYRLFKAEQHRTFLRELVSALGNDDFLLCGQLDEATLSELRREFHRSGTLSPKSSKRLEAAIRDVLDVVAGIQLNPLERIRDPKGPYCSLHSTEFFDRFLGPAVTRILQEPAYAEKILGFYIQQGYVNHHSGHCHGEDGTLTLRKSLRSALRTNPDYMLFFEWNELNENTMFQPTLWNGNAIGRILRYCSRQLKGLSPDPYPGDDPTVPNLTLSHRATAKVGEVLDFEILNVPDGVSGERMGVQLQLEDEKGRLVQAFPVESMDAKLFGSVSYRMSTREFCGGDVLVPVLTVKGRRYRGFHPIRLAATVSWNYKVVRHSLRDRLTPSRSAFNICRTEKNRYAYDVDLAFDEPLASVELIANENEQDAAGASLEYDREESEILRLVLTAPPGKAVRKANITVSVDRAKGCRFHNVWIANVDPGVLNVFKDGSGFSTSALIWCQELTFFIEVPKRAAREARIAVDVTSKETPCHRVLLDVTESLSAGVVGAVINENGARADLWRKDDLTDIPFHLKGTNCVWKGTTTTDVHSPVFHLRAVSESGRIWRSAPICVGNESASSSRVSFAAFDEFAHARFLASAPADIIPEITYRFDPKTGADLANDWSSAFHAQLGGGFPSDQAYGDGVQPSMPGRRDPRWEKEDEQWCLAFDGQNDYVAFPREALPHGAFTLTMEIKPRLPTNDVSMVLFRHFNRIRGSLSLFVRNGMLCATWGDRDLAKGPTFKTKLPVKDGDWNRISVSYDFSAFVFRVNDETCQFPWCGRAWSFKPSIFGGHDKRELSPSHAVPVYFRGLLRAFSIRHR